MNVMVVDVERIILGAETSVVKRALPDAQVCSFQRAVEALEFAKDNHVDIALLGISKNGTINLQIANQLKDINPNSIIILCVSYEGNALDEREINDFSCIMKPITEERLKKVLESYRI